jgi:hypothetical protein
MGGHECIQVDRLTAIGPAHVVGQHFVQPAWPVAIVRLSLHRPPISMNCEL